MRITIIGWYGTETIGDRAILAGLFQFFNTIFNDFEVNLGSLYPFFTQRTLNEDYTLYKSPSGKAPNISLFNSRKHSELDKHLKNSDMLIIGGGPLMDLIELYMIEYAFKKAKLLHKKTCILGCGLGPLFQKKYRLTVLNIINNSDLVILRDNASKEVLRNIFREFNRERDFSNIFVSFDPAVNFALNYLKNNTMKFEDYIAVNLRAFPDAYNHEINPQSIHKYLIKFLRDLSKQNIGREIRLIPMQYFHSGGDDREFLNWVKSNLNMPSFVVQNKPFTLIETTNCFQNAYFNVGMRFHSIVLQTITNGRNFVLDYTEPQKGKISGFLSDIDKEGFYTSRYISLQETKTTDMPIFFNDSKFRYDIVVIEKKLSIYIDKICEL